MPEWRKTIRIKDLLSGDSSDDAARTAARGMAKRLARLSEYETDDELMVLVSEFEDIADTQSEKAMLCDSFNVVLGYLYDWADAERIWIDGTRKTGTGTQP